MVVDKGDAKGRNRWTYVSFYKSEGMLGLGMAVLHQSGYSILRAG